MKDFIQKLLRETLEGIFVEDARRLESLPKTTALFIKETGDSYDLTLYDPESNNIYSTITISSEPENPKNTFSVDGIATEKGFGPFMYELAMMLVEGRGLMPSRDGEVRDGAMAVWNRFYDRDDVIKDTIPLHDDDFSFSLYSQYDLMDDEYLKYEWYDELVADGEEKRIIIFNTIFKMKKSSEFEELLKRGQSYLNKGLDIDKLMMLSHRFFNKKLLNQ